MLIIEKKIIQKLLKLFSEKPLLDDRGGFSFRKLFVKKNLIYKGEFYEV